MTLLARLRSFLEGHSGMGAPLAARRERREAARRRHHETGEPAWTPDDRHVERDGEVWVADVTPGTPGHTASVRTIRDD